MTPGREDTHSTGETGAEVPPPPLIVSRIELAEQIHNGVPRFGDFLTGLPDSLRLFVASVTKSDHVPSGYRWLITQAVNELLDLLFAASTGEGRSAVKAARSLLDLLIAAKEITASSEAMARYETHRVVVFHQAARLMELEEQALTGSERKSAAHWRRKATRATQGPHDEAIAQYGARFARGWDTTTIAARAEKHGMADDYEVFRLASAVLHGSAGGVIGTYAEPDGVPVLRTGPALSLCPLALLTGLKYFDELTTISGQYQDVVGTADVHRAMAQGGDVWPDYRRFVWEMNASWWNDAPRHDVMTVVEVLPYGREQWHVHDALLGMIRRAHPPTLPDDQRQEVGRLIAAVRRKMSDEALIRERMSIGVAHVRAEPVADAPWEHEGRILVQQPFGGFRDDEKITPEKPHVITADPVTGEPDIR